MQSQLDGNTSGHPGTWIAFCKTSSACTELQAENPVQFEMMQNVLAQAALAMP